MQDPAESLKFALESDDEDNLPSSTHKTTPAPDIPKILQQVLKTPASSREDKTHSAREGDTPLCVRMEK